MEDKKSIGDFPPINEQPSIDTKEGRKEIYNNYINWKEIFGKARIAIMSDIEVEQLDDLIKEFE